MSERGESETTGRTTTAIAAAMLCALVLLVLLITLLDYARQYFFLFDDFALIELARTHSAAQLLVDPLIGYYRPLPFVLLRAETLLFGWNHPAAYLIVSLLFHTANGVLCAGLTSLLVPRTLAAAIALVLCIASPWATEAFLWASGLSDMMSMFGVMLALIGIRLTLPGPGVGARATAGVVLAGAGALVAVFSKENAVVIPALAVVAVLVDRPVKALFGRPTLLALAACSVPVVAYLALRSLVLGMLSGAYGDFGALWNNASLIANIYSYARVVGWPPIRPAWPPYDVAFMAPLRYAYVFAILPAALMTLAASCPRLLAACVVAFLIATLPVCWFGLTADSTVAGRYAYLPAVLAVIAISAGLARLTDALSLALRVGSSWLASVLAVSPLALSLAFVGASAWYQVDLWSSACRLSRGTLMQLEAYRGRGDVALDIQNMPFMFMEGPYVLKAYAFRLYRDDDGPFPPVKAHSWILKFPWSGEPFASSGIDPTSDYLDRPPAGLTEQSIRLRLTP